MTGPLRVLVCGGRDFAKRQFVYTVLDAMLEAHRDRGLLVIHGGARGADRLAGDWACARGVPCMVFPAPWAGLGKQAGPARNGWMLAHGRPDVAVRFPGGRGTDDMVERCLRAGVQVAGYVP